MNWNNFTDSSGRIFDLAHLHPHLITYELPMTVVRPKRLAVVRVTYGLHCFTKGVSDGELVDPSLIYFRNPEGRIFCEARWEMSQDLPRLIQSLLGRNCFATDRRNHVFFSTAQSDQGDELAVFFRLAKANSRVAQDANLMIVSSHLRKGFRPGGKPVKFRDLLRITV